MPEYDGEIRLSVKLTPEEIRKSAGELRSEIEKIFQVNGNTLDKEMKSMLNQLDRLYARSEQLEKELQKIAETKTPTDAYKENNKDLEKAAEDLGNIQTAMQILNREAEEESAAYKESVQEFEQLQNTLYDLQAQKLALWAKGDDAGIKAINPEIQHVTEAIQQMTPAYNEIKAAHEAYLQEYEEEKQQYQVYEQQAFAHVKILNQEREALERTGKAYIMGTETDAFKQKSSQLAQVNNQISLLKAKLPQVKAAFTPITTQLKQFAATAGKALGTLSGKLFQSGVSKLKSSLKSLGSSFGHATKKAQSMTKSFLLAMIGVRGLSTLFSKIKSAISEGVKNISEFDKKNNEFAKSMENLKANTTFMKNAFGAAFAPLIQIVIPYLNMATQAIGNFMNKLGALFSMLSGKSTFLAAKSQVDEYGNAINKAAGSQKKLNAELYGFDTLNKQQDKSGSGTDVSNMFEEKNVGDFLSQNIKDFINDVKELWENKDFFNLGKKIAEGVNSGITMLDAAINNARPKLVEGMHNLTAGLNGFVAEFDFKNLGTTFADGLNTILDVSNTFLREFDFLNLGTGIGDSIVAFFQGTEWDELGANIALKINALFSFLEGVVSNQELLPSIGTAIHDTIYGFFDTLEPEHIKNTIVNLINNVANLLSSIDWGETFDLAFSGIAGIVDWVFDLINDIDWAKVGEALGKIVMDLLLKIWNPQTYIKLLGHITSWVLTLLNAVIQFLLGAWSGAIDRVIQKMRDLGFDTIAGFFQGIKDTLDVWISALKHWFNDMIDAVKELFGIHSPSTVFSDIGGWIIEGLKQGILDMWDKVKNGIYDTFDGFTKKVKGIFGISSPSKLFKEYGEFIDLGFAEGIEGKQSVVTDAFDDVMGQMNFSNAAFPNISQLAKTPIPALATGGVVPPNAYGSHGTTSDNGLISKIQELIDRLDGGSSPVEVHAHLELDGKEIYDTVVTQNNNQIQRTGTSRIKV